MMNIMMGIALLCCGTGYAQILSEKTEALHSEALAQKNPHITEKTHPVLYAMIQRLTRLASVAMPRYTSLYPVERTIVDGNGVVHATTNAIKAWVDALGDLHICREIVTDLSYEQAEGVIAVALAEKAQNKPLKLAGIGCGTFVATIACMALLNKSYKWTDAIMDRADYDHYGAEQRLKVLMMCTVLPAALVVRIAANYMQKVADLAAASLVGSNKVADGIESLEKLEDTYSKENVFSRIANALRLKQICNTLFYPIRAYTNEERIAYLEQ